MKKLRPILLLLFVFFTSTKVVGQSLTYSFTDPCTKEVTHFSIPIQSGGGTTIFFLGQQRYFTANDVASGDFANWINQTYSNYRKISPCGIQQGQVTQNQITSQIIGSTIQSVIGSIMSQAKSESNSTEGSLVSDDNKSSDDKKTNKKNNGTNNNTNGSSSNSSSNEVRGQSQPNTGTSSQNGNGSSSQGNGNSTNNGGSTNSNNSSQGGSSSSQPSVGSAGNTSPQTNNGSNGNTTPQTNGGSSGNGNSTENGGSSNSGNSTSGNGTTPQANSTSGGGNGNTTDNKTNKSGNEVVGATTMSVDSKNEKEGGSGSGKGNARSNPVTVSSDSTNAQNLDRSYTGIINVGMSRSSVTGSSSWGINSMIWFNFQQFALTGRYTKIHYSKSHKLKLIHNFNLTGVYSYGNILGFVGYSAILNAGKFGITGLNVSGAMAKTPDDNNLFLSPSATAFYTKPFRASKKIILSPELYVISTPLIYSSVDKVTVSDRTFSAFIGTGVDYQITKKFKMNLNYKLNMSTNPDFPILSFFLIGSKINL